MTQPTRFSLAATTVLLALGAIMSVSALYRARVGSEREEGERLFSQMGNEDGDLRPREADALWKIRQSSLRAKLHILNLVISDENAAEQFQAHPDNLIHAIVGLDASRRRAVVVEVLSRCYSSVIDPQAIRAWACLSMIAALDAGSANALAYASRFPIKEWDDNHLIAAAGASLTNAGPVFDLVLSAYGKAKAAGDSDSLPDIAGLLEPLAPFVPGDRAEFWRQKLYARAADRKDLQTPEAALSDGQAAEELRKGLAGMRAMSEPRCSSLASFVRQNTLPQIIDVLKWPTCRTTDRDLLIKKIGELKTLRFGQDFNGTYRADLWKFVEWAESQGLDVSN